MDLIVNMKFIFRNQYLLITLVYYLILHVCISRIKATKGYEKRWNELQQYFNSEPHQKEPGTSSNHSRPTPKVIFTWLDSTLSATLHMTEYICVQT